MHSLKDLEEYLKLISVVECLKLTVWCLDPLKRNWPISWFMATKEHIKGYEEYKIKFIDQFCSK
jgi:hypothetical protein